MQLSSIWDLRYWRVLRLRVDRRDLLHQLLLLLRRQHFIDRLLGRALFLDAVGHAGLQVRHHRLISVPAFMGLIPIGTTL